MSAHDAMALVLSWAPVAFLVCVVAAFCLSMIRSAITGKDDGFL